MYVLGIVSAILAVLLMRNTTLKGETPPFIMELPAYHAPQFKNLMLHLWDKAKHFIKKAFTIILASTIVIWLFSHFSFAWEFLEDDQISESVLAQISRFVQPLFTPLGFGSQLGANGWVFVVAAIAGLIAKENVIATFGTLASCLIAVGAIGGLGLDIEAEDGIDAVRAMIEATGVSVPGLIAFIAFNMTTIPCFAAVATAKAEVGNKKAFNGTLLFWLAASFVIATAVYTIGSFPWTIALWVLAIAAVAVGVVIYNKRIFTTKI
jgi:ferrous iron transport protein B